ncbi:MAG: hypothetical protein RLO17_14585 [Cyclobacteriaceae bacterium]
MTNQLLKTITAAILIGAALYFIPIFFVGKLFFLLLIGFFIFRFFRRRRHYPGSYPWKYADNIRAMSDEEYQSFKDRFSDCASDFNSQNPQNKDKS